MVLKGFEGSYGAQLTREPYTHYVRFQGNWARLGVGVFETRNLLSWWAGIDEKGGKIKVSVPTSCDHHLKANVVKGILVDRILG